MEKARNIRIGMWITIVTLLLSFYLFVDFNNVVIHCNIVNAEKEEQPKQVVIKQVGKIGIHEVKGTIYHAVAAQCDDTPLITADNSKINLSDLKNQKIRWVALSRDLLKRWGGPYNYGDTLTVHHPNSKVNGKWVVHDCMNARFKKRIDFLVDVKRKFPHIANSILISNSNFYTSDNR